MSSANKKAGRDIWDPLVVEMLVCPLTKSTLTLSADKTELISPGARMAYPIVRGVPLLCLSEARTLSEEETDRLHLGKPL